MKHNIQKIIQKTLSFNLQTSKKGHTFQQAGFTLLELLVVIGIIGILVSMGFTSYSTAQKKARDSKVKGDISAIQNALEQYYSVCGYTYPISSGDVMPTAVVCSTPPVSNIMPSAPVHPKLGTSYYYNSDGTTYNLCAPTPPFESQSDTTYCLSNQQ